MSDHVTGQETASAPSVERERLYTDREIGKLIRLATERQDQADAASHRGLSLGEVERIASEVGIDPRHVRAAAADLEGTRLSAGRSRITGGPFVIGHRRIVEGTLSEADWSEIVSELRVRLGGTGRVEQLGGSWEWTRQVRDLDTVLSETQVRIRPNVDQTTIDVRTHFGGGATVGYLAGVVLGGSAAAVIAASAGHPLPVDVLVVGTGIVGGLVTARASVGAWTRRRRRTLKRVIDWLDERIAATRQPPARSFPAYPTGQENPLPVLPPAPASLPPGSGE